MLAFVSLFVCALLNASPVFFLLTAGIFCVRVCSELSRIEEEATTVEHEAEIDAYLQAEYSELQKKAPQPKPEKHAIIEEQAPKPAEVSDEQVSEHQTEQIRNVGRPSPERKPAENAPPVEGEGHTGAVPGQRPREGVGRGPGIDVTRTERDRGGGEGVRGVPLPADREGTTEPRGEPEPLTRAEEVASVEESGA